jgi:hypothetical protein
MKNLQGGTLPRPPIKMSPPSPSPPRQPPTIWDLHGSIFGASGELERFGERVAAAVDAPIFWREMPRQTVFMRIHNRSRAGLIVGTKIESSPLSRPQSSTWQLSGDHGGGHCGNEGRDGHADFIAE